VAVFEEPADDAQDNGIRAGASESVLTTLHLSVNFLQLTAPCWVYAHSQTAYIVAVFAWIVLGELTVELTAVFEKVPEGYIAFVEELPGANTQGATLQEARTNLKEAVELVLEANRELAEESIRGRTVVKERLITAA
jgi:predicted RNase H-like HicB family nuclease